MYGSEQIYTKVLKGNEIGEVYKNNPQRACGGVSVLTSSNQLEEKHTKKRNRTKELKRSQSKTNLFKYKVQYKTLQT